MPGEGLLSAFGAINIIFEYLNPKRSPYVIPTLVATIVLLVDGIRSSETISVTHILFVTPVIVAFLFFVILSVKFHDPKIFKLLESSNASDKEEALEELDSQFKFSRALGISVSLVGLYFLYTRHSGNQVWELPSILAYVVCIVHLGTFLLYTTMFNVRRDRPEQHSLFQVSFLMSAVLFLVVHFSQGVTSQQMVFCLAGEPECATPTFAMLFWVFVAFWLYFERFWTIYLMHRLQVRFVNI